MPRIQRSTPEMQTIQQRPHSLVWDRLSATRSGATIALASIGGAGTFDGIVLSGIVAAYLA